MTVSALARMITSLKIDLAMVIGVKGTAMAIAEETVTDLVTETINVATAETVMTVVAVTIVAIVAMRDIIVVIEDVIADEIGTIHAMIGVIATTEG